MQNKNFNYVRGSGGYYAQVRKVAIDDEIRRKNKKRSERQIKRLSNAPTLVFDPEVSLETEYETIMPSKIDPNILKRIERIKACSPTSTIELNEIPIFDMELDVNKSPAKSPSYTPVKNKKKMWAPLSVDPVRSISFVDSKSDSVGHSGSPRSEYSFIKYP